MPSIELSDSERDTFRERGLLSIRRFVVGAKLERAKDAVIHELTRLGARSNNKWNAAKFPRQLRHLPELDELIPKELETALCALAGRRLVQAEKHPQLLLTPPQQVDWTVPAIGWHLDVASPSHDELPGIQVFVLVDEVGPRGGGAVAVAGSHRLHGPRAGAATSAHKTLQLDSQYSQLFRPDSGDRERFFRPHTVNGVIVQVVEMCGAPGDAYLMDMRTIHAPAPNAARRPRMMLTSRFLSLPQRG